MGVIYTGYMCPFCTHPFRGEGATGGMGRPFGSTFASPLEPLEGVTTAVLLCSRQHWSLAS